MLRAAVQMSSTPTAATMMRPASGTTMALLDSSPRCLGLDRLFAEQYQPPPAGGTVRRAHMAYAPFTGGLHGLAPAGELSARRRTKTAPSAGGSDPYERA